MSAQPLSAQQLNALDFSQYAGLRAAAKQNDPAALKQAAQQFEALFTQMMLKSMRDALPGDSTLGAQGDFYTSLYDQQLSTTLASGKGMGLADLLVKQLAQSSDAAGAASASVNSASSIAAYSKTAKRAAIDEPGEVGASEWTPGDADSFLDAIRPHAEKAAQALGVPTRAIMAQAVLETGWGRRIPRDTDGRPTLNLFGIKAGSNWSGKTVETGTQEYVDGEFRDESARFRAYGSLSETFDDYVKFLSRNPRYVEALRKDSVGDFAQGLQKAGYATDPAYARKIVDVANSRDMSAALTRGKPRLYSV
jgi:peptidoglycan hydrolase FlgJ